MQVLGTEHRSLRVDLTDGERMKLGEEIAKAIQAQESAENAKQEVAAQFKADIERHRSAAAKIAKVLANGYEYRDVECTVYAIEGKAHVVRNDEEELVQVREMTEGERQSTLPLDQQTDTPTDAATEAAPQQ